MLKNYKINDSLYFSYETVTDHRQCVTEDQRYSAKGYVPKPSAEKGKRKQAGWVDIVQSVMNNKDLPNEQRQFLNIIAKFDNVPRKKNKFQVFIFIIYNVTNHTPHEILHFFYGHISILLGTIFFFVIV